MLCIVSKAWYCCLGLYCREETRGGQFIVCKNLKFFICAVLCCALPLLAHFVRLLESNQETLLDYVKGCRR